MEQNRELLQKEKQADSGLEQLSEQFEKVKADQVQKPATRIVTLRHSSCCGCGCQHYEVRREVPWDSPLQDGHSTGMIQKGEQYRSEGTREWSKWW